MTPHDTTAPYVAVIFTSRHTGIDPDEYATAAAHMNQLAARQPGYLGVDSVRDDDGTSITVSYWATESDAVAWKRQSEHLAVQRRGRADWYERYHVRVATVHREYTYDRAHVSSHEGTVG